MQELRNIFQGGVDTNDVLYKNGIKFQYNSDTSLIESCDYYKHQFEKIKYSSKDKSTLAQCKLNVGNMFTDTLSSYLEFEVEITDIPNKDVSLDGVATTFTQDFQSFLNLIKNIRLVSAQGDEIERVEKSNLLNNWKVLQENQENYLEMLATPVGFFEKSTLNYTILDKEIVSDPVSKVCLPLSFLLGIFSSTQLMPPHIMKQAMLEIEWEDGQVAFTQSVVGYTLPLTEPVGTIEYVIHNATCVLKQVKFPANIIESINNEISNSPNGFNIRFLTWYTQEYKDELIDENNEGDYTYEIKKAFTCVKQVIAKPRIYKPKTTGKIFLGLDNPYVDSFKARHGDKYFEDEGTAELARPVVNQYQWKHGSKYYPDQPVKLVSSTVYKSLIEYLAGSFTTIANYSGNSILRSVLNRDAVAKFSSPSTIVQDWEASQGVLSLDLNRGTRSPDTCSSAMANCTNGSSISSQRIDVTRPLTLNIHMLPGQLYGLGTDTNIKTYLNMNVFIQHEKVLTWINNEFRIQE